MDMLRCIAWWTMGLFAVDAGWALGSLSAKQVPIEPWWVSVVGALIVMIGSAYQWDNRFAPVQKESDAGD